MTFSLSCLSWGTDSEPNAGSPAGLPPSSRGPVRSLLGTVALGGSACQEAPPREFRCSLPWVGVPTLPLAPLSEAPTHTHREGICKSLLCSCQIRLLGPSKHSSGETGRWSLTQAMTWGPLPQPDPGGDGLRVGGGPFTLGRCSQGDSPRCGAVTSFPVHPGTLGLGSLRYQCLLVTWAAGIQLACPRKAHAGRRSHPIRRPVWLSGVLPSSLPGSVLPGALCGLAGALGLSPALGCKQAGSGVPGCRLGVLPEEF